MQWRVNCSQSQGLGSDELGKANWGWSWKERWIAARPWESRVAPQFVSPKKVQANTAAKTPKTPVSVQKPSSNGKETPKTNGKIPASVKTPSSNGKEAAKKTRARRLSYPSSEKPVAKKENLKAEVANESSSKVEETNGESSKVEEANDTKNEESVS